LILADKDEPDLISMARPFLNVLETQPLEALLAEMQRKRIHVAFVRNNDGAWTGFLTLEDVIEEIIGTIRDEFEDEEQIHLSDVLEEQHVQLGIEANDTVDAVRQAFSRIKHWKLPVSREQIIKAVDERETPRSKPTWAKAWGCLTVVSSACNSPSCSSSAQKRESLTAEITNALNYSFCR
jgi:Mg2+/Co2+ transporter CorB